MNRNENFNVFIFLVGAIFCSAIMHACQPPMTVVKFKSLVTVLQNELLIKEKQAAMYAAYAAGNLTVEEVAAKIERHQKAYDFLLKANQIARNMNKDMQELKESFNVVDEVKIDSIVDEI